MSAGGSAPRNLGGKLDRVAQLLHRDPHGVQPFGQVHGAGVVHGLVQSRRAPGDARVESPSATRARRSPRRDSSASRRSSATRSELAGSATHLALRQAVRQALPRLVALLRDGDRRRARAPHDAACETRAARQSAAAERRARVHVPRRVVTFRRRRPIFRPRDAVELEHRQQLPQPPGRHARAVQRDDVAVFDRLERAREAAQAFLRASSDRSATVGRMIIVE